jgi:uncharacterized protein YecT (DUF1311 family)
MLPARGGSTRALGVMKRCVVVALGLLSCQSLRAELDPDVVEALLRATTGLTRDEIVQNYDKCDGSTFSMKICGAYRWMVEDLRMNRLYEEAIAMVRRFEAESTLREAQRAWLSFRDAECTFQGDIGAGGGSAEGLYVLSCKEDLTRQRADQLAELLKLYASSRGRR